MRLIVWIGKSLVRALCDFEPLYCIRSLCLGHQHLNKRERLHGFDGKIIVKNTL